ncbi:MAG: Ig-like domain-containing protein [Lachnospiraceae bacterium]|nr:Ig-like domain-containing protein [Lachnospiraceae bacterium]
MTLSVNGTETLTATVIPNDTTSDKTVTWTSDNTSVATVSSTGTVTGIAEGTAVITAAAGDKSAECRVRVTDNYDEEKSSVSGNDASDDEEKNDGDTENSTSENAVSENETKENEDPYDYSGETDTDDASANALSAVFTEDILYYTGAAIKPVVKVYGNGKLLTDGYDYKIKYVNNKNASADADGKALSGITKKPAAVITGKGNYRGKLTLEFAIRQKSVSSQDVAYSDAVVTDAAKAVPVMSYRGIKLKKNKDFTYSISGSTLVVEGKGNYCGKVEIPVNTVSSKAEIGKLKVSVGSSSYTYDGKLKDASADNLITVSDKKGNTLQAGKDYVIVLTDNTAAGTMKVTVAGRGDTSGLVTKKIKIAPAKISAVMEGLENSYTYVYGGVRPEPVVKYGDIILTKGVDYKLTYSGNSKTGQASVKAAFIGNYKGSTAVTKTFMITPVSIADASFRALAPDLVSNGKAGTYYSAPYVEVNHVLLKSSDYTCSYYSDAGCTAEITKSAPLSVSGDAATVYVKISGKGNYTGTAPIISYKVYPSGKASLQSAKAVLKDSEGNVIKTMDYTGSTVKPASADVTLSGSAVSADSYKIVCFGNLYKGMAVAVINGNGGTYCGAKAVKYSVKAGDVETLYKLK